MVEFFSVLHPDLQLCVWIKRVGEEYKNLRLQALQEFPENFRATYEEEAAYSDSQWQAWLKDAQAENSTIFLFAQKEGDSAIAGMAGARPGKSSKTAHVATIFFCVYCTRGARQWCCKKFNTGYLCRG